MNQQTEALAKQAAEYAIEFATQDQEQYIPKLMEKFAELIVQQCCEVFKKNWTMAGHEHPISKIKEHFGIE